MKKKVYYSALLLVLAFQPIGIFAQKDSVYIKKIPHQISLEFGYRYSFYKNTYLGTDGTYINGSGVLNSASNGVGVLADYGWQLSGFNGRKPAVYLTIPMGYSVLFPDNPTSKRIGMLNYGWTIRHELTTKDKAIIPFIGYGLFLNNLSVKGVSGSVSGHQTQFEGGLNFKTNTKLNYFVKLQVSYSSYPKLDYKKSLHFMYTDLRFGVRI